MNRELAGAVAGVAATAPMTGAMLAMHAMLPAEEQYPLPPRQITEKAAVETGVRQQIDEAEQTGLTYMAHFGFGGAAGAVYGALAGRTGLPAPVEGALYGLTVWSVAYLGVLPGLGLLTPATEHPPRRNALMIAAHLVWGSALGLLMDGLSPERDGSPQHSRPAR